MRDLARLLRGRDKPLGQARPLRREFCRPDRAGGGFRWHVVEADEELAEQSGELILLAL